MSYKQKLRRVDPRYCGCTDCLTGYSKPLNAVSDKQLRKLLAGRLINATGYDPDDFVQVRFDGTLQGVVMPWNKSAFLDHARQLMR